MEAFLAYIYGCGGHFGNMTSIIFINFHFLITESSIRNLVHYDPLVSEKAIFKFPM